MNVVRKLPKRIVSVLLAAALALSPVAAFAGHQEMTRTVHAVAMDEMPPCDMPCGDCAKGKISPVCAIACSGLIAAIASPIVAMPYSTVMRLRVISAVPSVGRDREPDKPPPRPALPEPA
jgi:hypothetical protein